MEAQLAASETPTAAEITWLPTLSQAIMFLSAPRQHIHYTWEWNPAPKPQTLQAAFDALVRRHAMLRTTFVASAAREVSAITRQVYRAPLDVIDLRELDQDRALSEARTIAREMVDSPFDLSAGPLFRVTLFLLSNEYALTLLVAHHAICDAWSCAVIRSELMRLYKAAADNRSLSLPPPGLEYADYVRDEAAWYQGEEARRHVAFWRSRIGEQTDPFRLPADRRALPAESDDLPPTRGHVESTTVAALRSVCRSERTTMFNCVATAFAITLARWKQSGDVSLWVMHLGRRSAATLGCVGLFADSWLLHLMLDDTLTTRDAMRAVRIAQLEGLPHIRIPACSVVMDLMAAGVTISPCAIFNFLPYRASPSEPLTRSVDLVPGRGCLDLESGIALVINVTEREDTIGWSIQHQSLLFEDRTIRQVSNSLADVLRSFAANPDQRLRPWIQAGLVATTQAGSHADTRGYPP